MPRPSVLTCCAALQATMTKAMSSSPEPIQNFAWTPLSSSYSSPPVFSKAFSFSSRNLIFVFSSAMSPADGDED